MAIGRTEIYRTKRVIFTLICHFAHIFRRFGKFFSRIYAKTNEAGVRTISGISASVGDSGDAGAFVGVSIVANIPAIVGLSLSVYDCDVPIVSASVDLTVTNFMLVNTCFC
jgi:hypothetical protein